MKDYYANRAPVYDRVYSYPERQSDLRVLEQRVAERLKDRVVLEVAAGTGYWTQFIASAAARIVATDAVQEPLDQLMARGLPAATVTTRIVDAYDLSTLSSDFSGGFAGCWVSHVPRQDLGRFFAALHGRLLPGARVVLLDNSQRQTERLPIVATDDARNTYQERRTDDGSRYQVLKNFPTEAELMAHLADEGEAFTYSAFDHYWWLDYVKR